MNKARSIRTLLVGRGILPRAVGPTADYPVSGGSGPEYV